MIDGSVLYCSISASILARFIAITSLDLMPDYLSQILCSLLSRTSPPHPPHRRYNPSSAVTLPGHPPARPSTATLLPLATACGGCRCRGCGGWRSCRLPPSCFSKTPHDSGDE